MSCDKRIAEVMNKKIELMRRIDSLIKSGACGSASTISKQLGVNRSAFFRILGEMKELGAPIDYDEFGKKYVYLDSGRFVIGFLEGE